MGGAEISRFGILPSGATVERITLRGGGLVARVLTHGARLQDLRHRAAPHSLVLGAAELAPYLGPMENFGATVGRYANRIAGGRFEIDGRTWRTDRNFLGRHTLHGGAEGMARQLWRIEAAAADRVTLGLVLPDGHMGFPGRLAARVCYATPGDGVLQVEMTATCDAACPVSLAHHSYFNLDGGRDVAGHVLWIDADAYLPVDADLIPTGAVAPVAGTAFDFRVPRPIGRHGYDHNFCLSRAEMPLRPVARLTSPKAAVALSVHTTAPGLQVYDARHLPAAGLPGPDGRRLGPRSGVALETQAWPDAPNRAGFPPTILQPGDRYRHEVRYVFG